VASKESGGHTPPQAVQKVGQRAVRWIEEGRAGRNFTDVGRHRADQLAKDSPSPTPT